MISKATDGIVYKEERQNMMKKGIIAAIFVALMLITIILWPFEGRTLQIAYGNLQEDTRNIRDTSSTNNCAIVIVPGILGSNLFNNNGNQIWSPTGIGITGLFLDQMYLSESGVPQQNLSAQASNINNSNTNYGANDTYEDLYLGLYNAFGDSCDVIFFSYDFRLNNSTAANQLQTVLAGYDQIVFVSHSMGGLVTSKFLANSENNRNRTILNVSVAVPYTGAAKCIDAMYTGEIVKQLGLYLYKNQMRQMSMNSYASYQLLPTEDYRNETGYYPVKVGNVYYDNAITVLKNTLWGKYQGTNNVKPMFDAASSFHSSLFLSGVHSTMLVPTVYMAGIGANTIKTINLDSSYDKTGVEFVNDGDDTILSGSANPQGLAYTYPNKTHMSMVTDNTMISTIISIINYMAGIPADYLSAGSDRQMSFAGCDPNHIIKNRRGWITAIGNTEIDARRIVILTDESSILFQYDSIIEELGGDLIDHEGRIIGNVETGIKGGKKIYILNDGAYCLKGFDTVKADYMNAGYYEKSIYVDGCNGACVLDIGDFSNKRVSCFGIGEDGAGICVKSIVEMSEEALDSLNSDEEEHVYE